RDAEGVHRQDPFVGKYPAAVRLLEKWLDAAADAGRRAGRPASFRQGGQLRADNQIDAAVAIQVAGVDSPVQTVNVGRRETLRRLLPVALAVPQPHARPGGVGGDDVELAVAVDVDELDGVAPVGQRQT